MGYNEIKAYINANIKTNGDQEITGAKLNSALIDMLDYTNDFQKIVTLPSSVFSESGYISSFSGQPFDGSSWVRTPFIFIDKSIDIVATHIGASSGCAAIAFYDNNKNFISCLDHNGNTEDKIVAKANIPSNAVYIRCASLTSSVTSDTTNTTCSQQGIADIAKSETDYITEIEQSVRAKGTEIYTIPGYYISLSTGNLVAFDSYSASNYIRVNKDFDIALNNISGDSSVAAIAFYNNNKSFISAIAFTSATSLVVAKANIPSNAVYYRVSETTASVANTTIINNTATNVIKQATDIISLLDNVYNFWDYNAALNMPKSLLRTMVETASNGAVTVIWDNAGYPSMMYRIPKISIGALAPSLGDDQTTHPAFSVNGVEKNCIYVAVYQTSVVDGHPVSWYGLAPSGYQGYANSKSAAAAKGSGWHLETIYERSLLGLLSTKINGLSPRCNSYYGRSHLANYAYETCQREDGQLAGVNTFAAKWINGSQPNAWSHNGERWGIFDLIGGYWEWCDLIKVVNGQIYLASDNNFNSAESSWIATGAYIDVDTNNDNAIRMNNARSAAVDDIVIKSWASIACTTGYDTLDESLRKKLALLLVAPRLSSTDNEPIFNFQSSVYIKNTITAYPICGGAEEYIDAGFGKNAYAYNSDEHGNMGARLCYIE